MNQQLGLPEDTGFKRSGCGERFGYGVKYFAKRGIASESTDDLIEKLENMGFKNGGEFKWL